VRNAAGVIRLRIVYESDSVGAKSDREKHPRVVTLRGSILTVVGVEDRLDTIVKFSLCEVIRIDVYTYDRILWSSC